MMKLKALRPSPLAEVLKKCPPTTKYHQMDRDRIRDRLICNKNMALNIEVLKKFPLVYIATPYSKYPGGIELAFRDASKLAAALLRAGINIICPIAHTHPIAIHGDIDPLDHDFWMKADSPFMEISDALLVGKLESWDHSDGIKEEIKHFRRALKPIFLIDPYTMELECAFDRFHACGEKRDARGFQAQR